MMRHANRYVLLPGVLLAGVMLGLLLLGGSASAASRSTSSFPFTKTTLTHTGVERLLAHGERLRLTSKIAEKTEVRLFVYGRALDRGGQRPVQDPMRRSISRPTPTSSSITPAFDGSPFT